MPKRDFESYLDLKLIEKYFRASLAVGAVNMVGYANDTFIVTDKSAFIRMTEEELVNCFNRRDIWDKLPTNEDTGYAYKGGETIRMDEEGLNFIVRAWERYTNIKELEMIDPQPWTYISGRAIESRLFYGPERFQLFLCRGMMEMFGTSTKRYQYFLTKVNRAVLIHDKVNGPVGVLQALEMSDLESTQTPEETDE
jgi:hypothetical protein